MVPHIGSILTLFVFWHEMNLVLILQSFESKTILQFHYIKILCLILKFDSFQTEYLIFFLQVTDAGNIHLRVGDFLMDVYGFNITYEIVDINVNLRTDACSVYKCSFLGKK